MTRLKRARRITASWILVLATLGGCIATADGYDENVSVSYGVGFYEPWGYGYDGWNDGYRLGPPRGGERHRVGPERAYHPARQSHRTPTIPTRGRGHH